MAGNIYNELDMFYKNTLLSKMSYLKAYEKLNAEHKSAWVELSLTSTHLSRRIFAENLVIFPTLNTILVMKVYQMPKPVQDTMASKIIQLKLLQKYLPRRLGNMIDARTRFVFVLVMPQAQNGVEFLRKMRFLRDACHGCKEYILDANSNYKDWLHKNILHQGEDIFSLDLLVEQTLGLQHFVEGHNNTPCPSSYISKSDESELSSKLDSTKSSCRCKMNFGLNKISNLEVPPTKDPLYSVLEPFPCMFLKGPADSGDLPKQVMEVFNHGTRDFLQEIHESFISIPPDHEPFFMAVVNKSKSSDDQERKTQFEVSDEVTVEQKEQRNKFKSFHAEDVVYGKAQHAVKMKGGPGFAMKNFHSANYQQPLKKNASHLRNDIFKAMKEKESEISQESFVPLNDIELEIMKIFKIDFEDKNEYIDFIIHEVKETLKPEANSVSDHRLIKDFKKDFGKDLKKFNIDCTEQYVEFMLYQHGIKKQSMEIDTLIILPEAKLIIEIETKSPTEDTNFLNNIEKAKSQLENFQQFLSNTQSDILSEDWFLVKAVAIPLIDDINSCTNQQKLNSKGNICEYCQFFILDQRKLEVMTRWIESVTEMIPQRYPIDHEYKNLLIRLIGFSSIQEGFNEACFSLTDNRKSHELAMIGTVSGLTNEQPAGTDMKLSSMKNEGAVQKSGISCRKTSGLVKQGGVYDEEDTVTSKKNGSSNEISNGSDITMNELDKMVKGLDLSNDGSSKISAASPKKIRKSTTKHKCTSKKKVESVPICSLKNFIYWRLDQLSVLQSNRRRVILNSNYGTGKTFLLKCKAQEIAGRLNENVIYLSLTGLRHPKYDPHTWREPRILQICDRIDFQRFPQVKVLGACDIVDEFAADHQITGDEMFVEMLNYFLRKPENKSLHLFIDEIPTCDNQEFKPFTLDGLETDEDGSTDRYIWLALRPQYVNNTSKKYVEIGFDEWQNQMKDSPYFFWIPHLSDNMRNAVNVFNFTKLFRDYKSFQTSSSSKLPSHSVPGNSPIVVKTSKPMVCSVRFVLDKYFAKDLDEPVVVLCTSRMFLQNLYQDLVRHSNGRNILFFDPKISADKIKEQEEKFIEFIKNPKGVLVTDVDSFGGMQARNVIVLSVRGSTVNTNSVLRCTTSLVFINAVKGQLMHEADEFVDKELSKKLKDIAILSTVAFKVCKSIVKDLVDMI